MLVFLKVNAPLIEVMDSDRVPTAVLYLFPNFKFGFQPVPSNRLVFRKWLSEM